MQGFNEVKMKELGREVQRLENKMRMNPDSPEVLEEMAMVLERYAFEILKLSDDMKETVSMMNRWRL